MGAWLLPPVVMTVPMPFWMHVARLHVGPLLVQMVVPVLWRMNVPGLRMNLMAPPLAIPVPFRLNVPGLRVNPRGMPLALAVALRMEVPWSRMLQPHAPSVSLVLRMPMPSPVMTMDDERTVVRGSQSHADADPAPVLRPLAGRRTEQSADDAADDRSFPRPLVIGAGGRLRHGRAEHDNGRERDSANKTPFPAPHHRHPPFSIGSR